MKSLILATAAALAFAAIADAAPKAPVKAAPAAVAKPAGPSAADWRTPDPDNLMVIDTNQGRIIVEMAPQLAPEHVARIRELTKAHFYDGLTFFRVIDNFMDQTGDPKNTGEGGSDKPDLKAEFTFRRGKDTPFAPVATPNGGVVGFVGAVPVMSQPDMMMELTADHRTTGWGLYCPGVAGMARSNEPDSANSQFFLMRGPYPSLEKRYTVWGRVISGMDVVRKIKTGEPVADPQDKMLKVRMASELTGPERPQVKVVDTGGAWFKAEVEKMRQAKGADFSACDLEIPAIVK